ncbi:MAG: type II toxin-antitoxin system RelE/ParE family toxin [Pseudomonadota bacterium]
MKENIMQSVAETRSYVAKAEKILTLSERDKVIDLLAYHPTVGSIIEGTGGVRKVRFAIGNKGQSGGVRVVYYYYNESIPILLLSLFAKNEKSNLSDAECKALSQIVKAIKQSLK